MRQFTRYLLPHWPYIALSLAAMLVFVALSGLLIWMIGPLVATIFQQSDATAAAASTGWAAAIRDSFNRLLESLIFRPDRTETLWRLCGAVIVISVVKNIFQYIQNFTVAIVQQRVVRRLRDDLFAHIHTLSVEFFAGMRTGEVISRVTNDIRILQEMLEMGFGRLVKDPMLILVFVGSLFVISWQLTLLALVVWPLTVVVMVVVGRFMRRYSGRAQEKMADMAAIVEESVSGVRVVKAFAMERFERGKFLQATTAYYRAMLKMARVRMLNSPINEVLGTVAGVAILYVGGSAVFGGSGPTPDEFMQYLFLMFSLIAPIKAVANIHARIQESAAAAARVFDLMNTPPTVVDAPGARTLPPLADRIRFDKVSFAYDAAAEVLHGIDLEITHGETVALVGPSGGGKSTLCDLLIRFHDPTHGRITIDGVDLRNVTTDSLHRQMGIVTQDVILFNDTIANNIAYGTADVAPDKLRRAAEAAHATEFIDKLPDGFDTEIGTRGTKLSGGQRQRIAIARAILKDPAVLIFDEATSALDAESERAVQRAIENLVKGRTAIIVAHRLSTVMGADRIVVIDDGRTVDTGTHDDLYAGDGLYRKLCDLQLSQPATESSERSEGSDHEGADIPAPTANTLSDRR